MTFERAQLSELHLHHPPPNSRAQLDTLYRALTAHPMGKAVLPQGAVPHCGTSRMARSTGAPFTHSSENQAQPVAGSMARLCASGPTKPRHNVCSLAGRTVSASQALV